MKKADQGCRDGHGYQPIHAINNPTMARNKGASVLNPMKSLER
jgi:hypothetical protein